MEASNPAKSVPAGFSSQYPQTKRPDALKRPVSLLAGAAGSSAPHAYGTGALRMSDIAAIKKESDIAVGTIIGSNIFNILGILGVSAMITPLSSSGITGLDSGWWRPLSWPSGVLPRRDNASRTTKDGTRSSATHATGLG